MNKEPEIKFSGPHLEREEIFIIISYFWKLFFASFFSNQLCSRELMSFYISLIEYFSHVKNKYHRFYSNMPPHVYKLLSSSAKNKF